MPRSSRSHVLARVAGISRQAIYRVPRRRPVAAGRGRVSETDAAIVKVARANPTDGTRMVAALATRELSVPVNRKRVQRIMRQHQLLQPTRHTGRRQRPAIRRQTLPPPSHRPWHHAPTWRLPRPRVPGLHRVVVWPVQETARLARRMGNPRPRQKGDHHLPHHLRPAPAPLRDRLPNTHRTRHHLEARTPTHPNNQNQQHPTGPDQVGGITRFIEDSRVASSSWSRPFQGPRFLISSVLYRPMIDSASALS